LVKLAAGATPGCVQSRDRNVPYGEKERFVGAPPVALWFFPHDPQFTRDGLTFARRAGVARRDAMRIEPHGDTMGHSADGEPFRIEAEDGVAASPHFSGWFEKFVHITCNPGDSPIRISVMIKDGGSEEANKTLAVQEAKRVAAVLGLCKSTPND
jgi:hypothetical protein